MNIYLQSAIKATFNENHRTCWINIANYAVVL